MSLQGDIPQTDVGRVYVFDLDDWDLPDKKFYWADDHENEYFLLDEETGMITLRKGTPNGK